MISLQYRNVEMNVEEEEQLRTLNSKLYFGNVSEVQKNNCYRISCVLQLIEV